MKSGTSVFMATAVGVLLTAKALAATPHNLILFVPDGLRPGIVDQSTAPTMTRLREEGVNFVNSHSLFPTFTTANASAFATGHLLGDTGDYSNSIYTLVPLQGSVTPFLENDAILRDLNRQLGGNYLNEPSIIAAAAALPEPDQITTALIGKLGPVAIFDPSALEGMGTLIVDDSTGQPGQDIPIPAGWRKLIEDSRIKPVNAPSRGDNGIPGTFIANLAQQQYFLEITLKVVLPRFKEVGRPFVLVYWSRDPDGSQHTQGDGGINAPTSMMAVRSADGALAAIEQTLKALGLYETTNIIVASDHGFSTIAKDSENGSRKLPTGFVAVDLASALRKDNSNMQLYDPDNANRPVDPLSAHPSKGNGLIGIGPKFPQVVVAVNGGSDLIYLPALGPQGPLAEGDEVPPREQRRIKKLGERIVRILLDRDYVSGIFIDERKLGKIAGSLTLQDIGLRGQAKTPAPTIVVNFRSYMGASCDKPDPLLCARDVSDTTYPVGGGMHGSFSRADTWNFMAARGPDFRSHYVDQLPVSSADIGATITQLLQLQLIPKGKLSGRVLSESLRDHDKDPLPKVESITRESDPAPNGCKTILRMQAVGPYTYYDTAGFAGRTAGLEDAVRTHGQ